VEPKDNYVLENVVGRFSDKDNENCSNSYDVYIKDGIFADDEYADDCSWGVLFYFSNSKNIDKTLSNYKSKVLSKNNGI
jgi:hypothetical protein